MRSANQALPAILNYLIKKYGSPKIGSAKPVRSLIPDRFFETITTLFRTTRNTYKNCRMLLRNEAYQHIKA